MVECLTWPLAAIRAAATSDPALAADAARVVLEVTATRGASGLRSLWRATARLVGGALRDEAGRALDAPEHAEARVAHPLDLTDRERATWAAAIPAQPFPQLRRPTFSTPPVALPAGRLPPDLLARRLRDQGWSPDAPRAGGVVLGATWALPGRGARGQVAHDPVAADEPAAIRALTFSDGAGRPLTGDAVPAVVRSEAWRAVLTLLAG